MAEEARSQGDQTPQIPSRGFEFVEPQEGKLFVYSNYHRIGFTAYDIRILFSELIDVTDDKLVLEERVQVTLSWYQAKNLLASLQEKIATFEATNGEITTPTV